MEVKITCIKGLVWLLTVTTPFGIHYEKWFDRKKAQVRATLLAGINGRVIE